MMLRSYKLRKASKFVADGKTKFDKVFGEFYNRITETSLKLSTEFISQKVTTDENK